MDIFRCLNDIPELAGAAVTIGTFDGVHRGHQALFDRSLQTARRSGHPAVAITFDPHPQHVTRSASDPLKTLITSLETKCELIAASGINMLVVVPFDREFSLLSATEFLRRVIVSRLHPDVIIVGHDHHFGYQREGNYQFLQRKKNKYGFEVIEVDPVLDDDIVISSTSIRQFISSGEIQTANRLLGWQYSLKGLVVPGAGRGRKLGIPTANIKPLDPTQLIPGHGVYCVTVTEGNQILNGICNIGIRPTFGQYAQDTIEVHIIDEKVTDLYGHELRLTFHRYLRREIKFDTELDLIRQIEQDKLNCLNRQANVNENGE